VLVVGQVAVSLVLLVGAALFLRTIANLRQVDLGFAPEHLIVLDVNPHAAGYAGDRAVELTRRLIDRIAAVPGVSAVSVSENGVLAGRDSSTNLMHPEGLFAGRDGYPRMQWDVVGPQYFSTLGTPLVSGRDFTARDSIGAPSVIAINETAARQLFDGVSPLGRRMVWGDDAEPRVFEIVAVTRDVKQGGPRDDRQLRFYLPYYQLAQVRPNWVVASTRLLVRTAADPSSVVPGLRQAIPSVEPRLPIDYLDLGPDLVGRTLVQERMIASLLVVFGLLAAGLACLGLYGLLAYHVAQRTSEIGIRMALGARRADVLAATLRRALLWIAAGAAIGVPLAAGASRLAQGMLFGLEGGDAGALTGAVVLMSLLGLLAAYLPARGASRVDPLIAIRCE
jgi:predicted permease